MEARVQPTQKPSTERKVTMSAMGIARAAYDRRAAPIRKSTTWAAIATIKMVPVSRERSMVRAYERVDPSVQRGGSPLESEQCRVSLASGASVGARIY
jgi:hypothetical protein